MDEFRRRQRDAASTIVAAYEELTRSRGELTEAERRAVEIALATSGGRQARERAAAAVVRPALSESEVLARAKAKDILTAVAAMSENWKEHEELWDDLRPEDLPVVEDTIASWAELRQAAAGARDSDRVVQASLENFRSLGPHAAEVSDGLITAIAGVASASSEVQALADEYLDVLDAIRSRLRGG